MVTPPAGEGRKDAGLATLAAEAKSAAEATAGLWPDTSKRLERLGQVLQAQQDSRETSG